MTTWIAFLRALNVGGRRLTNDQLAEAFVDSGMGHVRTFLASGNVVFTTAVSDEPHLVAVLEAGLHDALGYEVPTYLRREDAIRSLAALDPFDGLAGSPDGKPQVMILAADLDEQTAEAVRATGPPR